MTAYTKSLNDGMMPHDGAGQAVLFDGGGAHVNLGLMGNMGSNLGSGLYIKIDLLSDFSGDGTLIGTGSSGSQYFKIGVNGGGVDRFTITLRDNAGLNLSGRVHSLPTRDRNKRTIEIQLTPSTNTIEVWVNGVAQTIVYTAQQSPTTFVNFTRKVSVGCRDNGFGTNVEGSRGIFDNLRIGINPSTLYGIYNCNDTSFPIQDSSGNSNHGTAGGSPQLVLGFDQMPKSIGRTITDSMGFIEIFTKALTAFRTFTDSISLQESMSKGASKTFTEDTPEILLIDENGDYIVDENGDIYQMSGAGLNLTETFSRSTKRSFSEQITLIETFTKKAVQIARTLIIGIKNVGTKISITQIRNRIKIERL